MHGKRVKRKHIPTKASSNGQSVKFPIILFKYQFATHKLRSIHFQLPFSLHPLTRIPRFCEIEVEFFIFITVFASSKAAVHPSPSPALRPPPAPPPLPYHFTYSLHSFDSLYNEQLRNNQLLCPLAKKYNFSHRNALNRRRILIRKKPRVLVKSVKKALGNQSKKYIHFRSKGKVDALNV